MNSGYLGNFYDVTRIFHSLAVLTHRNPRRFWHWDALLKDAEDVRRR